MIGVREYGGGKTVRRNRSQHMAPQKERGAPSVGARRSKREDVEGTLLQKGKRRRGQQMMKVRGAGETKRPMTTARPALPRFAHCWRSGSTHARKERGGVGYVTTRGPGLRKLGDIHLRARCVPLTSTPSQGRHREQRTVCALWCVASTARVPMRTTGISVCSFELEAF